MTPPESKAAQTASEAASQPPMPDIGQSEPPTVEVGAPAADVAPIAAVPAPAAPAPAAPAPAPAAAAPAPAAAAPAPAVAAPAPAAAAPAPAPTNGAPDSGEPMPMLPPADPAAIAAAATVPTAGLPETRTAQRPDGMLAETRVTPRPAAETVEAVPIERIRYFEDATVLIKKALDEVGDGDIIGWAHDRIDPDTMGANGLVWYLLQELYGKSYACYYSKRMSFLMNRSLATNFMPNGVLRRCEATENLSEITHKSSLIIVLDATSPEIMMDFARLLRRSEELREKNILFVDHHRRGQSDLEDLPNSVGVRYQGGQATSAIMVHVLRNLGLDLANAGDDGFRLAVVARAGIETDLIGVDPDGYADSTVDALAYLDGILGERGTKILDKLRSIKHPLSWYQKLGQALSQVDRFDSMVAVAGLGVINDTGVVPFVANRLMDLGPFKTTIVFGIVYEVIEGHIISVDVDASGRSSQDTEVILPDLFHEVFFVTDPSGRKTPKGGGRANMLMGDYSGAGASVPLDYWRHLGTKSADEKIDVLHRLAWPAEFLRISHLLTSRIPSLKSEEIRSLVPIPGLEGVHDGV